ncbi:hypothetical protein [Sandaracinus amylolyticus]|uniref:hypothetical protein n=1 Tax=Sandaracinus amylolyticus TaxID=927083 RepID=UPI001F1815D5|nr:hypothetical protein [Sandaracinus amylolyticus]UJR86332.1 Hypothetical protein I5071_84260 [Sandaracinus amylolyticus]
MSRSLAVLVVLASFPALAHAQYDRTGSLRAANTTQVAVAREEVELDCTVTGSPDELECALHVTWTLENASQDAQTPQIVLTWPHEEEARVTVAGAEIAELPTIRPLTVVVAPASTTTVELRATLTLDWNYVAGESGIPGPLESLDPLYARHPLLAQPWVKVRRGFVWVRPDDLRFASIGPTEVRVRVPEGWHPGADLRSSDEAHLLTYRSPRENAPRRIGLELTRGSRGDFFRHGGPFLAFGGTIDAGFRGRVGYEIGLDEFVLVSVALDTDFEEQVIITPQVELASWGMVLIPSVSLGLGVPVRVTSTEDHPSTVGLRIESSATFYAVAFVASLDVWPSEGDFALSLLGRIGL